MIYAFGQFEVDEELYELRARRQPVKLAPKVFDVLLFLIRHRERVVPKEELLAMCWPNEIVSESVLPTNITVARKALKDDRAGARVIQTVHGRGYRFVAPVTMVDRSAVQTDTGPPAKESEPPRAGTLAASPFVGREAIMADLRAELEEALAGRSRLVLLVGEPGIGKSRTAEELGLEARERGAKVLTARCYEGDGAPVFWPWVQILRAAVRPLDSSLLEPRMGAGAGDIAHLVPEVREKLGDLAAPQALDSEQARFRLFDSVSSFFGSISRDHPLVLVLDDLHWADEPTLLLLTFLVRELRDSRILLLGAFRDVDVRRHHPLVKVLGELAREPHFRRLLLRGLDPTEVARFLENTVGTQVPEPIVQAVVEMTEGNPFFIHETARLLQSQGVIKEPEGTGWTITLPQGVRDVVGRRLDTLSPACNEVLSFASVIGREFALPVLERLAQLSRERLLELLSEALEARIITDDPGANGHGAQLRFAHYAFSHTLIRETLYEELTAPGRVRLHRQVGEIFEQLYGSVADSHLAELAHHFFQAAPGGDVDRAIHYALLAAEQALVLLAYEDSVIQCQRALQALELEVPVDEVRRAEILLALGEAQARVKPRGEEAAATVRRVAELARRLERPDLLGRAALGLGRLPFLAGPDAVNPSGESRALADEALESLGPGHEGLRARLISVKAVTSPDQDFMDRRSTLSGQALALARQTGDPEALFDALWARQWALLGPDDTRRRWEVVTEILELAESTGAKEKAFTAHEDRMRSLIVLGDIAAADREIEACARLAEEIRLPHYHLSTTRLRVMRALADGRFADAERLADEAKAQWQETSDRNAALVDTVWRLLLLWSRGRLSEFPLSEFLDENAWLGSVARAIVAYFYSTMERFDSARHHFEVLAAHDFTDLIRDENWASTLFLSAGVCADLGDRKRAAVLYPLLLPYADTLVSHQTVRVYFGSAQSWLGRLSALLSRRREAIRHFEAALETDARLGARPSLARAQYELARVLLERAVPDRRLPVTASAERRARGLLAEAETTAAGLGMDELLDKIRRL